MKNFHALLLCLTVLACLAAGCVADTSEAGVPLQISVDRQYFTPTMSSTAGIGLTPVYPAAVDNATVSFLWQADYGHFVRWEGPDFRVNRTGSEVVTGNSKIYWSYSPEEMGREKPTVHVTLSMVRKATGNVINTTSLTIGWKDGDVAQVLDPI